MKISANPPIHLTYCLNVHPGEDWAENFAAIRNEAAAVRQGVAANQPFGLGLRLSDRAARQLAEGENLPAFRQYLRDNDLYVFTINGFPYGRFHGTAVKRNVYQPDWTTPQRRDYTNRLGDILTALLDEETTGSISTVPLAYNDLADSRQHVNNAVAMVAESAMHMDGLLQQTGREIVIALECEPDCLLETTRQAVEFFAGPLIEHGATHLREHFDIPAGHAEKILQRHVGVCFDTAHQAVEFENLSDSLRQLRAAGIRIAKIQLSSALRLQPTPENLERLRAFQDEVYLHQVRAGSDEGGESIALGDLPDALTSQSPAVTTTEQWRVHFHVPLFFETYAGLASTSDMLRGEFAELLRSGICPHLEIETYTWNVLPAEHNTWLASKPCHPTTTTPHTNTAPLEPCHPKQCHPAECKTDIVKGIIKEFQWVQQNIFPAANDMDN